MSLAVIAFWACIATVLFVYAGYPLLAFAAGAARARPVRRSDTTPGVTVLIAAFNEAASIEVTVRNKLEQDYPPGTLDVIVVSDASSDGTDDIVRGLAEEFPGRVALIRQEPRQGKTAGLNRAVGEARGEILVFSDANSVYRPGAMRRLVRNFADPEVGYVTGKMVYVHEDGSLVGDGCSLFMRYENFLRTHETRIGSVVGVDGGIDAVRKDLYQPMRADQLPDFVLPLRVAERGFRVVFEDEALLEEDALKAPADEYRMRVRVALRALWALWDRRRVMNPLVTGVFAFQVVGHKLLRYLVFLPLAGALVLNLFLATQGWVYALALCVQLLFYLLALLGTALPAGGPLARVCNPPQYFVLVNLAFAHALLRFLRGDKQATWSPRVG